MRSSGSAGTGDADRRPSAHGRGGPVQKPFPSMPPSLMTTTTNGRVSSVEPSYAAGSKVASLAQRTGTQTATGASAGWFQPDTHGHDNGSAAPRPTPRFKAAAAGASNETHLSRWATPAPASPPPAAALSASPTPAAAPVPASSTSQPSQPTLQSAAQPPPPPPPAPTEGKQVPHLTINGLASARSGSNAPSSSSSGVLTARPRSPATVEAKNGGTATPPPPQPTLHTSSAALPPPVPSKTTAAFIAAATAAKAGPGPAPSPSPTASGFKLNGAAADFQMPTPTEHRQPELFEKVSTVDSTLSRPCWLPGILADSSRTVRARARLPDFPAAVLDPNRRSAPMLTRWNESSRGCRSRRPSRSESSEPR